MCWGLGDPPSPSVLAIGKLAFRQDGSNWRVAGPLSIGRWPLLREVPREAGGGPLGVHQQVHIAAAVRAGAPLESRIAVGPRAHSLAAEPGPPASTQPSRGCGQMLCPSERSVSAHMSGCVRRCARCSDASSLANGNHTAARLRIRPPASTRPAAGGCALWSSWLRAPVHTRAADFFCLWRPVPLLRAVTQPHAPHAAKS